MKKDDPKFIKDEMYKYIEKFTHHHYQHADGTVILFIPYIKNDNVAVFTIKIKQQPDGTMSYDHSAGYSKREFKQSLFMSYRLNNKITSIKKYARHIEIIDNAKLFLQSKEFNISSYKDRYETAKLLFEHLNKPSQL